MLFCFYLFKYKKLFCKSNDMYRLLENNRNGFIPFDCIRDKQEDLLSQVISQET